MTEGTSEKGDFRPDIEGLRGIAVMLVVLFHAGLLSNASIQLRGGFVGVDLFFVISGFLITGLLIRERERTGHISFSRFYARRVRRIIPAAAVVLLITMPIAYLLETPTSRPGSMQDGAAAALSIANIRFVLTTDYFHPTSYSPFLHFWSLGVEEQFYFIWPAVMAIVAWRRPRLGAAIALSSIVIFGFIAGVIVTQGNPAAAFYSLPTRAWQLAAGGLLAIGAGSLDRLPDRSRVLATRCLAPLGWAAFAALLLAATSIDWATTPYPGAWALVPTAAGVILIGSGGQRFGPGFLLRQAPARFLGRISYSLYLWHWPVLILGGLWLRGPLSELISRGQALALAGLSIPIAALSWALVEEPFRQNRVRLPRPSRVVAGGVAAMLIVALLGLGLQTRANLALASISDPTHPAVQVHPRATPTTVSYAITSGIRPSVQNAAEDGSRAGKCMVDWLTTQPPGDCVFGDVTGSYTVALVGDSHAEALLPAVEAVAKAHGWRVITFLKAACPFINDLPIYDSIIKREYTECPVWNKKVVSLLNADPPNLVLITMLRWIKPMVDKQGEASQGKALAQMIDKIPATTRKVIIQDPPLPSTGKVPDCLSANMDDYRRCAYSREVGFGAGIGVREKAASKATGAGLIDLSSDVCPGVGACPVIIDDMIVWRDSNHLTATFSTSLGPALDSKLMAVLASAPADASNSPSPPNR